MELSTTQDGSVFLPVRFLFESSLAFADLWIIKILCYDFSFEKQYEIVLF